MVVDVLLKEISLQEVWQVQLQVSLPVGPKRQDTPGLLWLLSALLASVCSVRHCFLFKGLKGHICWSEVICSKL